MICDKCGFEHNSKSVCPKCGARVVYVDEEYLKRKKAWEEAQKNGEEANRDFARSLPPGIMFSSRDDDSNRSEPDDDIEQEEEAGFLAGLSFDIVKNKIHGFFQLAFTFFRVLAKKRAQRRSVDQDTVVRQSSIKVKMSRKKRNQLVIAALVVVVAVTALIIGIRIIKNRDNTSIIVYDGKYAYYADDMDDAIWGSKNGVSFTASENGSKFLVWDTDGVRFYNGREATVLTTSDGEVKILAKNDELDMVLFSQDNKYYVYSDEGLKEIEIPDEGDVTEEYGSSDDGKYITFTLFEPDSEIYTLMEVSSDGTVKEIYSDSGRISIVNTSSDGQIVFLSMDTAEYGIINEVRLCYYDGETKSEMADGITDARYESDFIFYITEDGKLCRIDIDNDENTVIAKNVTAFSDSTIAGLEDSFIYETEDGYYCLDTSADEPELLFNSSSNALTIYYDIQKEYLYYTDMNTLYYVSEIGGTGEKILNISSDEQLVELDDSLLAVGSDKALYELTDDLEVIEENISDLQKIENYDGYVYIKDGARYYISGSDSTGIQISSDGEKKLADTSVIYSDKCLYYLDSSSVLWKISMDGENRTSLGTTEFFMLLR